MARGADEELLARLGVASADTKDYERDLLAQATKEAQEVENDGQLQDVDVEAAKAFLIDTDPHTNSRKSRIEDVLATLDSEIAAVISAREAFGSSVSVDKKAEETLTGSKKGGRGKGKGKGKEIKIEGGAESMHLTLLDERLESLKRKRGNLRLKLKSLGKPARNVEAGESPRPIGEHLGEPSTAGVKRQKEQPSAKRKTVALVEDDDFDAALDAASGIVETEREKLVRLGIITPFSKVDGFERKVQRKSIESSLQRRGRDDDLIDSVAASMVAINNARPSTKLLESSQLPALAPPTREFRQVRTPFKRVSADENSNPKGHSKSGVKRKRPLADKRWRKRTNDSSDDESNTVENAKAGDGVPAPRKRRLRLAYKSSLDTEDIVQQEGQEQENLDDDEEELEDEDDEEQDVVLEGGLKIPGAIYNKLFDYQKTGVKWMWELHCQRAGGIIGDEMGLGKTIQVIAFLAALHYSGMYSPSIVICPVTLLQQWKREVKKWYPSIKAEILHESVWKGSIKKGKKKAGEPEAGSEENEEVEISESDSDSETEKRTKISGKGTKKWSAMINSIVESNSKLLVTTYEQLRLHREKLLPVSWGYAVLDEGHRIRNPDAEVTLVCKQLQTVRRVIMTGAPIQNRLKELWSLFDFVFPGKLGVLPVFQAQFALPIQIGGYANASPLQVSTAYKCAVVLRDLILPYLLRRMKADVNANLTKKTEHVLFCSLTEEQRTAYRAFLGSSELEQILEGQRNSLYGIDALRKICNHPDLLEREQSAGHFDYGNPERSGKLKLVMQVLKLWKSEGHRVLLFAQTQQMLDILQNLAESQGYEYRRMDGSTAINQRMALIDEFNESEHVFLFILTTKVGGLGTNLIGANRVIIYDPDWNPSTDMQARERAWRIGQKKDVTIFRLITRGTIEEKVYHRQIYKHFLTNKILKDPRQRRIFKARDMKDLFTLQEDTPGQNKTETETLFGEDAGDIMVMDRERLKYKADMAEKAQKHSKSSGGDVEGNEDVDEDHQEEESRILKNLFEANGIHSAMDHDAIMAASDSEKVAMEREASRVAERAASAILQSRMLRSSDDVAVPTWTGRSGEAGAPVQVRRRFGNTSNSRLARSTAVQVTTVSATAQSQVSVGRGISTNLSRSSSLVTDLAAGTAAGSALSSSEILSRMRERRKEAINAGSMGIYGRPSATSSATRFGRGSSVASQAGQSSQNMTLSSGVQSQNGTGLNTVNFGGQVSSRPPISRFGRGRTVPGREPQSPASPFWS